MARNPLWVYNRYNTIIDRAGDPSMEDWEFTEQYNISALSVFKDCFGNNHMRNQDGDLQYAWEMSDTDTVKWQPLIIEKEIVCDGTGKLNTTTIETAINGKIYHIRFDRKNTDGDYRYCRFVRHNDRGIQAQNVFKKPSEKYPIWSGYDAYYLLEPKATRTIRTTVIKYPSELVLDLANTANDKPTDLTDSAIDEVLWRMAAQYGIQIREQELVQNSTMQEKQQ